MTMALHPTSNRDPAVVADKHTRLHASALHSPLVQLADNIAGSRGLPSGAVPYPDADGGGVNARALFVYSDPSAATDRTNGGSGLLSLDNDDASAARVWQLYQDTGLDRTQCVHWNAIPYNLHGKKPKIADFREGAAWLVQLLSLLPELRVVLLGGGNAHKGWDMARQIAELPSVPVLYTVHPSQRGLNSGGNRAEKLAHMTDMFTRVAELIR